jgi:hypothetical protein
MRTRKAPGPVVHAFLGREGGQESGGGDKRGPSSPAEERSSRQPPVSEVLAPEPAVQRYSRRTRALIAIGMALLGWAVVLGGVALVVFWPHHARP